MNKPDRLLYYGTLTLLLALLAVTVKLSLMVRYF